VAVEVLNAHPVEGKADLLSSRVGERLEIWVPRGTVPQGTVPVEGQPDDRWHVRASMVGPGVVRAETRPGDASHDEAKPPIEP